jgi:ribosomal protein S18 acetylase RimI-like enzyme
MDISIVSGVNDELVEALRRLIPQLTSNHPPPSREDLQELVDSGSSKLMIARLPDGRGPIVGALALTIYRVPTGTRAVIEDVVVDEAARGGGVGEAMVRAALELAWSAGAAGVALTSNPGRAAANRLYQRIGFVRRETNAYFYKFTS